MEGETEGKTVKHIQVFGRKYHDNKQNQPRNRYKSGTAPYKHPSQTPQKSQPTPQNITKLLECVNRKFDTVCGLMKSIEGMVTTLNKMMEEQQVADKQEPKKNPPTKTSTPSSSSSSSSSDEESSESTSSSTSSSSDSEDNTPESQSEEVSDKKETIEHMKSGSGNFVTEQPAVNDEDILLGTD